MSLIGTWNINISYAASNSVYVSDGFLYLSRTYSNLGNDPTTDTTNWRPGAEIQFTKGADIASATALTLGADGNYFDGTGTAAITSIVTVGVGAIAKIHFDGILTFTHDATGLILPGGADITTAAGDEAEVYEYAAGDWRCTSYTRASGEALVTVTVFASAAEVATGTEPEKAIAPLTAGDHLSAAKAWVSFRRTGTVLIDDDYNVTSITDDGTGSYTVNFDTNFAAADYTVVIGANRDGGSSFGFQGYDTKVAGSVHLTTTNTTGVATDYTEVAMSAFGVQ